MNNTQRITRLEGEVRILADEVRTSNRSQTEFIRHQKARDERLFEGIEFLKSQNEYLIEQNHSLHRKVDRLCNGKIRIGNEETGLIVDPPEGTVTEEDVQTLQGEVDEVYGGPEATEEQEQEGIEKLRQFFLGRIQGETVTLREICEELGVRGDFSLHNTAKNLYVMKRRIANHRNLIIRSSLPKGKGGILLPIGWSGIGSAHIHNTIFRMTDEERQQRGILI